MRTQLYPNDLREGAMLRTRSPMVIYLDTAGSDDGDGSAEHPYATWDRALQDIPLFIDHKVRVKARAGAYTSFPRQVRHFIGRLGILSFEGMDAPTVVAGPFTVDTATKVGVSDGAGWDLTVSGVAWSADQWYGKFVRFSTGDHIHSVHPIFFNGVDSIALTARCFDAIAAGDVFDIIEPNVCITVDHAPVFAIVGDGCPGRYIAQFAMANMEFVTDMDYYADPNAWHPYSYNGNCVATFGLVRFTGLNPFVVWSQRAGIINQFAFEPQALPILEDDTLIQVNTFMSAGSVQVLGSLTPPVSACGWVEYVGSDSAERGVGMSNVACRNGLYMDSVKAETQYSGYGYGFVDVDHQSKGMIMLGRIKAGGLSKAAVRCDDMSLLDLGWVWIDSCDTDAVLVTDLSRAILGSVGGTTADIAGYGVKIGKLSQVSIETGVDVEGVSGKVRFTQTDTTVNYPVAKAAETDSQGSWIAA